MENRYLFRGKRIDGQWIEGDLIHYESGKTAIFEDKLTDYGYEATELHKRTLVDPETVCQYTGLTDKNGKKIFEGDIINDIDYGIMRCVYLHGSFVWYKEDGFHIKCMNYIPVIEVIGNIFDNPDLLTTSSTDSD